MTHSRQRSFTLAALVVTATFIAACGASHTFHQGDTAARAGDWDTAVEHYRKAVQEEPKKPEYKIALERAMISASQIHLDQARILEARGQLEDALRQYQRASEFDPPNRQIAAKVIELERRVRDLAEASRPRPTLRQLTDQARQNGPQPLLNLTTVLPALRFGNNATLRDILSFIGSATQINVTYDNTFNDRNYAVQMDNVTLEEALNQILSANQLFYKVVNPRTIMVIPDTPAKRNQYEEQVIRTFYISHGDATEVSQILNSVVRVGGAQNPPSIAPNKTANSITVRGTAAVVGVIEKIIEANDNPRAEIVVDVQILEVNKSRAKQFGLDLGSYQIGAVFSPENSPTAGTTTTGGAGGTAAAVASAGQSPVFNANTISRGVNTTDFYLSVPSAVIRFLETDSETKLVAKPQLRGAEGQKITLNLGDKIPIPTTVFTPLAQGGANFNPLTSFQYQDVGVNVEMTPRVTFDDDIILELLVESSTLGQNILVAGTSLPSIGSRRVNTRLRLREGESTLLAGLLKEDERKSLSGFPGLIHVPIVKSLFASNDTSTTQTDIVMLLTPRIVRTHELTAAAVAPVYVGTQTNFGLAGPPPLIAAPAAPEPVPDATPQPGPIGAVPPAGAQAPRTPTATPALPPGSTPTQGPAPLTPAQGVGPGPSPVPRDPTGAAVPTPAAGGGAPGTGATGGQIAVSPPGPEFRVGGGPYTVPVAVNGASRLSTLTLTITYNPAALRVRAVQEGSFMRAGGVQAAFTQQSDATSGRIDIAIVRPGDTTGVTGTGLLAAILFDAVGSGPANITVTGSGAAPGGTPLTLQFAPVPPVAVR
jgi:type II secretory pathway component GspD/PulD (secretin)/Flp pilus assembly protein TadD